MNSLSKLMSILLVFSLVFCMFSVSSEAVSTNLVDKLKRDKWYADGDIDNYDFYYIGSDNQIHIGRTEYRYGNWETPYLYRYMGSPEITNIDSTLEKFKDVNRISSFAKTAVAWAVQNNVISGMADGRVAPTEGAARAQIALIIMRMDQQGMFNKA